MWPAKIGFRNLKSLSMPLFAGAYCKVLYPIERLPTHATAIRRLVCWSIIAANSTKQQFTKNFMGCGPKAEVQNLNFKQLKFT